MAARPTRSASPSPSSARLQAPQLHHQKNKVNDRERIEMKKYCRWDRQHTLHKETR